MPMCISTGRCLVEILINVSALREIQNAAFVPKAAFLLLISSIDIVLFLGIFYWVLIIDIPQYTTAGVRETGACKFNRKTLLPGGPS